MKFIDLFAGLGGFHLALRQLGHQCVFACEIDTTLAALYELNFGLKPAGDIRSVDAADIPAHDILCAGFPCQPFSKAGRQEGFKHTVLGGLYRDMLRIIRVHRPRYLLLENVPNLARHGNGKTWHTIEQLLRDEDYDVRITKLSPHEFGIPQIRERVIIVASTDGLDGFDWPKKASSTAALSIRKVLDTKPRDARPIPDQVRRCLDVWQRFLDQVPADEKIPHPLWAMEFGATYPYQGLAPARLSLAELSQYRGSFGASLRQAGSKFDLMALLPSHARRDQARFPDWKVQFIRRNRDFFQRHKKWLKEWLPQIEVFPSSFQKLEWNCQGETIRQIDRYVVQIRASGVRIKRPTTAPSLVAMTATQVPIITWEGRYMTPTEAKRLQSMDELQHLPQSTGKAYEALGNAVNVQVIKRVAQELLTANHSRQLRLNLSQPARMVSGTGLKATAKGTMNRGVK